MLASQVRAKGLDSAEHLNLVPPRDGRAIDEADLIAAIDDDTALVVVLDARAMHRKPVGDGFTQSAIAAGNERHLSGKIEHPGQ